MTKLKQAFGFQKTPSKEKVQPISKPKNEGMNVITDGSSAIIAARGGGSNPPLNGLAGATIASNTTTSYKSWVVEHPSALDSFKCMMKSAKGKKIAVFLDYDGTLSPTMHAAVQEVSKYFPTTIISVRSKEKVKEFVQLTKVYYAGSHGMEIMAPP